MTGEYRVAVKILTPQEAAEMLRLSMPTIYRMLNSGRLPGAKIGTVWRIREDELLESVKGGDA